MSFIDTQQQFTQYLRQPDSAPLPEGIEPRRMHVYRDLFYNNIEGFIRQCFPVFYSICEHTMWHDMVRDFMSRHYCRSPLFNEISHEFLHYLADERQVDSDPIFTQALCHYEWVELALSISDAEVVTVTEQYHDLLAQRWQRAPLAWLLSYDFAVHQISVDYQPQQKSEVPVFLLVYRDPNDEVLFIECNAVSARLMELLEAGHTGYQAAKIISEALQHQQPDVVQAGALQLMNDWVQRGIIYPAEPK